MTAFSTIQFMVLTYTNIIGSVNEQSSRHNIDTRKMGNCKKHLTEPNDMKSVHLPVNFRIGKIKVWQRGFFFSLSLLLIGCILGSWGACAYRQRGFAKKLHEFLENRIFFQNEKEEKDWKKERVRNKDRTDGQDV